MLIVGLGGTARPGSSSETALRCALEAAADAGAQVMCFGADDLRFPLYDPTSAERTAEAARFVQAVKEADGYVIASPATTGRFPVWSRMHSTMSRTSSPRHGRTSTADPWAASPSPPAGKRPSIHCARCAT